MILTALALAAATAAAPPQAERTPNVYRPPAGCGPMHDEVLRRIRTKLGDRPRAEYAVARQVDGCPVPAPMGYHPDYLLPGKADPRPPPAAAPPGPSR